MAVKILIIGATGRVGSKVVKEFDKKSDDTIIRLATTQSDIAEKWRQEGKDAAILDLNDPSTFAEALAGIDRVFLLTGYTADMLFQSKKLVDAAVDAGVSHIVHLGVFSSGRDLIPHFTWHDLVENYIKSSGIAWTNLHCNVITESILVIDPPIHVTNSFGSFFKDQPQGWVSTIDIAAVAATVLREGPEKHNNENYFLSTEVLTCNEIENILSDAAGREIKYISHEVEMLEEMVSKIPSVSTRAYMESAIITMKLASTGQMKAQEVVRDDVQKVLGRSGTTMKQWAHQYFAQVNE